MRTNVVLNLDAHIHHNIKTSKLKSRGSKMKNNFHITQKMTNSKIISAKKKEMFATYDNNNSGATPKAMRITTA